MSAYLGKHPRPRLDETNKDVSLSRARRSFIRNGKNCSPLSPFSDVVVIGTNQQTGSSNPNYKQDIARRSEAGTNYTLDRYYINKQSFGSSDSWYENTTCGGLIVPKKEESSIFFVPNNFAFKKAYNDTANDNIAISKIRNFANKADAHTNVLVPLVELRDFHATVKGISQATSVVLTSILDLHKAVKHPSELVKYVSDAWLTYSFGVKPMLSDASAIATSLAATLKGPIAETVRSKSKKNWNAYTVGDSGLPGWLGMGTDKLSHQIELTNRYGVGLDTAVRSSNTYSELANFNDHFALHVESFVPAIWELIPYSWLADYFANIGDVLSDRFETTPKIRYAWKSILYREKVKGITVANSSNSYAKNFAITKCPEWELEHVHYVRTVISSIPVRSFSFKTMDVVGFNATKKVLNLVSILGKSNRISALRL